MSPPTQSEIWIYFVQDEYDNNKAHCKICNKVYSRKGRTTTSLKNHLKSMHPEHFSKLGSLNEKKQLPMIKCDPGEIVTVLQEVREEFSLEEEVLTNTVWDTNNLNSKRIDQLIAEMIALHNLPSNFVEGLGFRRLIHELAPTYSIKRCNFYIDFITKEVYIKATEKVKELIKKFDYMSFTSEICSDPSSNGSMLMLTCHGIAENFNRSSVLLKSETFNNFHPGDIIAENFDTMLSEWSIKKEQVHCLIRDEDSNVKKDMRLAPFCDMDCIVHKMQLCILSFLQSQDNIKVVAQKCEKISNHFKHSIIAQKQLQQIQDRLNQPHIEMFHNSIKKINSTCYMFEHFLKVKDALSLYTNDCEIDSILPEEWKIIECCIDLLKPFEEATWELSKTKSLISSVIPIIQMLENTLNDYLTESHDCDPIQLAVTTLKTELSAKCSNLLEKNNTYAIATYLDPRYKHKFFTPLTEEKIKKDILKMRYTEDDGSNSLISLGAKRSRMTNSSEKDIVQSGISCTVKRSCILNDLAMMLDSSSDDDSQDTLENGTVDTLLMTELLCYRNKKRLNINENPLKWWSVHRRELQILSTIARRFLSPPPGSVSSVHSFSNPGLLFEPVVNELEPEMPAILRFIKYNAPILNFC